MKYLKFKKKIKILNPYNLKNYKLNNNYINLINVNYTQKKLLKKYQKNQKTISRNLLKLLLKY